MRLAPDPRTRRSSTLPSRLAVFVGVALASATVMSAALARSRRPADRSLHARVRAILAAERPYPARFSGSSRWSVCSTSSDEPRQRAGQCLNYRPRVDELRDAFALVAESTTAPGGAAWERSMLELSATPSPEQLDAVIERLSDLAAHRGTSAELLNDLAVAHLARSAVRDEPESRLEALDAIEHAHMMDSSSAAVEFNRALILQDLHLLEQATSAWSAYVAREQDRGWRDEAVAHLSEIRRARRDDVFRPTTVPLDSAVRADPQGAREYAIDTLTADWVHASGPGATDSLRRMMLLIGRSLVAWRGDSSVLHVAESLARDSSRGAAAVANFVVASADFRRGRYAQAEPTIARAERELRRRGAEPLADWGAILLSGVEMYGGRYASSDARMRKVALAARRRGDVALMARALWVLGLSEEKQGRTGDAIAHSAAAESLFHGLAERENEAVMRSQRADAEYLLGRDRVWIDAKLRVLADLDAPRHTLRRAGLLTDLGRQIADAGLPYAGVAILEEAARASSGTGRPSDHTEALIRLARAQFDVGESGRADRTLETAQQALADVSDPFMRDRMGMELSLASAVVAERRQPALAVDLFSRVIAYFTAQRLGYDAAAPLIHRAQARIRLLDSAGARRDLDAAVAAIESQSDIPNDAVAARDAAAVRSAAFHELVGLELAHPERALRLAQRGRGDRDGVVRRPAAGEATLVFEVLHDRSIMWVLTSAGLRMVRLPISEDRLDSLVAGEEAALRSGRDSSGPSDPSRALYDAFIAPAASDLRGVRRLTVITDGVLGRIPFAALRDERGDLLLDRVALHYASRLAGAAEPHAPGDAAVIIGDPSFDHALFPELAPLRAAAAETRAVASVYSRPTVLAGTMAVKTSVLQALGRASVVHFAGHAERVDRAPRLASLVLSRQPGGFGANALTAAEVSRLDLRHVGLVVLSSCGTMTPGRRAAGESGLATAFLDAGAGAVVSSVWDVDDDATAPLMTVFHRRLLAGAPPDIALQQAQLEMSRGSASGQGTGTWAAFRVETR